MSMRGQFGFKRKRWGFTLIVYNCLNAWIFRGVSSIIKGRCCWEDLVLWVNHFGPMLMLKQDEPHQVCSLGSKWCCELKSPLTPLFVDFYTFSTDNVTAVVMWWELVHKTAIVDGCRFNLCRRWRLSAVAGAFCMSIVTVVFTTLLTLSGNSKSFHLNFWENQPKTL